MQQKGESRQRVLEELHKVSAKDQRYSQGRIFCSMCTQPHPIAQKAYKMFLSSNLGDPSLFSGSEQLEKETVGMLAKLLHGDKTSGFIVSGGTEANLMALASAKASAGKGQPEVILPQSAHFSFAKICSLLDIEPIYAEIDSQFQVDPEDVESLVGENTIAIIGTAGTAELGTIDPIDALSNIALQRGVWLHVDAAFGGLVIPFLKGSHKPFDFSLPAVKSITVDPHKMGMAAVPAGGILFRENSLFSPLKIETPYLTEKAQYTFVGTRTGASVASAWAVFKLLGTEGFQKIVKGCIYTTKYLAKELKENGFVLVTEPSLNILAFRAQNSKALTKQLRRQGWFVSYIPRYDCVRLVVMPHVKRRHVVAFLKTLVEIESGKRSA